MQINSIVAKDYPCSHYTDCVFSNLSVINYSIIFFTGLPLKGAVDKKTSLMYLLFIQGLKRKLNLGIIDTVSRFWKSLSSVLFCTCWCSCTCVP